MTRKAWKFVHRCNRLYKKADGLPYGMRWLDLFGHWGEAWEELLKIAVAEDAGVICECGAVVITVEVGGTTAGECVMCGKGSDPEPFELTADAFRIVEVGP